MVDDPDVPGLSTQDRLTRAASRSRHLDADRAFKLLNSVAYEHLGHLEYREALANVQRMEPLLDRLDPWWRPRALGTIGEAHVMIGNTARANEAYDELIATDLVAAANVVQSFVWLERYDDARRALAESLARGRSDGNVLRVAWAQGTGAILELALGNLAKATTLAGEALTLTEVLRVDFLVTFNLVILAEADALQGRDDECRARIDKALQQHPGVAHDDLRNSAHITLGLFATSRGRFEDAVAELAPVHEVISRTALREPSIFPYQPDLVEAYTRLGHTPEAVDVLDLFEGQAEATGRRWALAAAARCRGLLAGADDIDERFSLALERHDVVPSPFERARTQLVYGERLRRANRRRDARPHLRASLETFTALGAAPWRDRAHAELRATGERVAKHAHDAREQLTPQELQIAMLVAEGKTNREIGAQIFLSPKTIEFYLTRVYRKLDVNSRRELIRLFARETPRSSPRDASPFRRRRTQRPSILNRHHDDPPLVLEDEVHEDHPAPGTEQEAKTGPSSAELGAHARELLQRSE